jgi:hypothetical protein
MVKEQTEAPTHSKNDEVKQEHIQSSQHDDHVLEN